MVYLGFVPDLDLFDGSRSPGDIVRALLEDRGWSQDQLAVITDRSRQAISDIVNNKASVSPEMAVVLGAAFDVPADAWLRADATCRLALINDDIEVSVKRRRSVYGYPIKEIQRRGWIKEGADLKVLEQELKRLLRVAELDQPPPFLVATKRSTSGALTPAQVAWCARAREMAEVVPAGRFDTRRMSHVERDLRRLAAYPKEARQLAKTLGAYGIRFVVVEPLPGAKIDGAAFWLDPVSPVIAVSIRFDRIDTFWFTVMHECSHIRHGDSLSVDVEIIDATKLPTAVNEEEARANQEAASSLIPPAELESFIRRVAPLYSRTRIIQLANRLKIHPGIIVGQLQHRGEIGFSALRDLLTKIRDCVTDTALTDGWGKLITPGML